MFTHLSVRHFATVDQLELEPEPGLTVISGETGAGKSVIIDALSLTLGERADSAVVRPGCDRAEVLTTFDVADNPAARAWLGERELDNGNECLLRRTVRADGRSRAYINGTPTPLTEVRELGEMLISIHSQHEHQALLRKETHRQLLDNFAEAGAQAEQVRDHWRAWQKARRAHDQALAGAREQTERQELLRFQLEELDALALSEGELPELGQEQQRLGNAEALIRLCQQAVTALYDGDEGTCNDQLGQVSHWVEEARRSDDALATVYDTVESARLQVEAAADDYGFDVLILNGGRDAERERRAVETHLQFQVEALILVGPKLDDDDIVRASAVAPTVVVHAPVLHVSPPSPPPAPAQTTYRYWHPPWPWPWLNLRDRFRFQSRFLSAQLGSGLRFLLQFRFGRFARGPPASPRFGGSGSGSRLC